MVHVLDIDVVCILQNAHFLTGDVAKDAHGKAGTGERMPLDESFGHPELVAHTAHFVFEEPL